MTRRARDDKNNNNTKHYKAHIMSHLHLSELSVQLRKLQNSLSEKNNEIDRLERQIRILSDLKGISIHELREALRLACEGEAHGELRALVGKLQAKVDSSTIESSGKGGFGRRDFGAEDNARARLALELRVGELEEIENSLRAQMSSLYQQIAQMTEDNTTLKTENLQQRVQLEEWDRKWKAIEEDKIKKGSIVTVPASTGSYNYSEVASDSQARFADQHRLLAAETALAGEKERRSLLQSQMESTNKSYELKLDQYQHRIRFLEGQINDLEQQMNSLYLAFDMMQTERTRERESTMMWKNNLLQSDAALAREQSEKEKGKQQLQQQQFSGDNPSRNPGCSTPRGALPAAKASKQALTPMASVKPLKNPPLVEGHLLLLLDNHDQPLLPQKNFASPTSKANRKLLFKTSSQRKSSPLGTLKKQYCVLHGSNGIYQLRYGDTYAGPVAGVHEFITTGISSIEHTERSSRFDYGFEIIINPNDVSEDSPSLCCTAESEEDFMKWMAALMNVIDGNV